MSEAMKVLQARLATGEISVEEFEARRRALGSERPESTMGPREVSFVDAMALFLRNTFEYEGRSSRGAYWWVLVWSLIMGIATAALDMALFGIDPQDPTPISAIVSILLVPPSVSLTVRRLHDVGRSGWWALLAFTIVGAIPLIVWYAKAGERQANRFGPDVEAGR
jgi:uncharacterized membrane protein YhaH (DUF805 family)